MRHLLIDVVVLVFSISVVNKTFASSIFVPDSDSATLIQIAMTLAKDFQTTLKLLNVAKDTQEVLGKVHGTISRKYYLARRIQYRLLRLKRLKKLKPKNLKELNNAIRAIKYNISSVERLYDSSGKELSYTGDDLEFVKMKIAVPAVQESEVEARIDDSHGSGVEGNTSNTALNTAYSVRILHDMNQTNNKMAERNLTKNQMDIEDRMRKLGEEQSMKDWAGLDDIRRLQTGEPKAEI